MLFMRVFGIGCVALMALALGASPAPAQSSRTIKIIVPYPPGSGPDITSRLMAEQISRMQNVSMVVENRPGGGTLIGTEAAMRAQPDGNTVLLVANSFVVNPALKPQPYDVTKNFDPVCQLATTPMVLVVPGPSPHRTLDDFTNVNCDPDTWSFKDGLFSCTGQPVGVIRTKEKFTNLELVVEWTESARRIVQLSCQPFGYLP